MPSHNSTAENLETMKEMAQELLRHTRVSDLLILFEVNYFYLCTLSSLTTKA